VELHKETVERKQAVEAEFRRRQDHAEAFETAPDQSREYASKHMASSWAASVSGVESALGALAEMKGSLYLRTETAVAVVEPFCAVTGGFEQPAPDVVAPVATPAGEVIDVRSVPDYTPVVLAQRLTSKMVSELGYVEGTSDKVGRGSKADEIHAENVETLRQWYDEEVPPSQKTPARLPDEW
jgi:hypothetical protein